MENFLSDFISVLIFIGVVVGAIFGYYIRKFVASRLFDSLEKRAREIEEQAKRKAQEISLKAKEEQLALIEKIKKEEQSRSQELKIVEEKLEKRRTLFDQKLLELEEAKQRLAEKLQRIEEIKEKVKASAEEAGRHLERISGLSKEEAKRILLEQVEKETKDEILNRLRKLEKEGKEELEKKTQELLVAAMERYASSVAQERTTSTVGLPSEEMKGRIIGREGRNIKTLEQLTGVEIIVDDTPQVITISCFSPLRRELAKKALEYLIADGRIQPSRIERAVEDAKKELAREIKEAGEEAVYRIGIIGLDSQLIQLLGRLKYRTSYGQNVLQHSIEVAHLAKIIASEVGANELVARKAGLLHDIGKALDQEMAGTHPEIGKYLGEKYGLGEEIIIPIATHHQDNPPTLEAIIVKVADALSGARPGAREGTYEDYLKRLEELEKIALAFPHVEKAYSLQAGREIRIFVKAEEIDDLETEKLAREVAKKIEAELRYPGEIRVTVIREKRIVDYAR